LIATGIDFVRAARRVRDHIGQRHRYVHILSVARTAARLAWAHGEDPARARTAGLLHDLARLYPAERLLRECAERGMPTDAFERANPVVLHARLGAELARDWFGVSDEAILSAIRKHTVAAATMSHLDEILYLADGLEPGREYAGRADMLALAFDDLAAAIAAHLTEALAHQRAREMIPAPQMLAALDHYAPMEPALSKCEGLREKRSA
jgi:predicted HD superfamily hydrolase involved in NAD metabolism